jgi:uncharacterized membrane protein
MIQQPFQLLVVFLGIIALAVWLAGRYSIAAKISPVLLILGISALLSNTGIIPTSGKFYNAIMDYALPFAVCLILFNVRLNDLKTAGMPMMFAFAVASFCSFVACIVGGRLLIHQFDAVLDGQGWKIAGPYIGTYIGGSLNFFSMWNALDMKNPSLFAAANAVDNLTLMFNFTFWILAVKLLEKFYPPPRIDVQAEQSEGMSKKMPVPLILQNLAILAFLGMFVVFISGFLRGTLLPKYLPAKWLLFMPAILIVTTLALIGGRFKFIQNLKGTQELGNFAFYLFFAAVGALMDIQIAIKLARVLFVFIIIVLFVQITLALVLGKIFGINLRVLAVAELAAKAGPATVVAYTNTTGWHYLALPGAAAALLGYAVGNYAGFAGAYLLKFILQ